MSRVRDWQPLADMPLVVLRFDPNRKYERTGDTPYCPLRHRLSTADAWRGVGWHEPTDANVMKC